MIEVTAFNWTYWFKCFLILTVALAGVLIPIQVYLAFKYDKSLSRKKMALISLVIVTIYSSYSYIRLPKLINDFEENKIIASGKLCEFEGSREWYTICIEGKYYKSNHASRNMLNDAIFNFGWMEKPTGCVEIEYLNLGEKEGVRGKPPHTEVAIGRLREINCNFINKTTLKGT